MGIVYLYFFISDILATLNHSITIYPHVCTQTAFVFVSMLCDKTQFSIIAHFIRVLILFMSHRFIGYTVRNLLATDVLSYGKHLELRLKFC